MPRPATLVSTAIASVAVLVAVGVPAGAAGGPTIKLGDNFFDPERKSIDKDTKVRFKWTGSEEHNVTKRRGPGRDFESDTTSARGVNFKRKFTKKGTYRLICTIHPDVMKLKIEVG